jgi:TRAP-type C4-dicarboxylate transport system permease small subunit
MSERDGDYARTDKPADAHSGPVVQISFWLGAAGLLVAMASDAVAVIGRHIGLPFLGSIELVQACVVVASSSAMVCATVLGAHATVHILMERVGARGRALLEAFGAGLGAVCFLALAIGSIWVARDLWGGHEQTELLTIPLMPLRLFWCASALLIAGLFTAKAVRSIISGSRP